jgi:hypothetical protein
VSSEALILRFYCSTLPFVCYSILTVDVHTIVVVAEVVVAFDRV